MVTSRIFELKRSKVSEELRTLHNEKCLRCVYL